MQELARGGEAGSERGIRHSTASFPLRLAGADSRKTAHEIMEITLGCAIIPMACPPSPEPIAR